MKKCKYCETEHDLAGHACRVCKDGLYRYGVTRVELLEMYESQNKSCALCNTEIKMFDGHKGGLVDHCHNTGKVRGILCISCNTMIGRLEKLENISDVIEYIGV
jgi:hypothetical protein